MLRARPGTWMTDQQGYRPPARRRGWCIAAATAGIVLCVILAWPHPAPVKEQTVFYAVDAPAAAKPAYRLPPRVIVGYPAGETTYTVAYSEKRLQNGLMLLVDEAHPVPQTLSPDAVGILQRSGGRVFCRDTTAVLATEAIDALDDLFRHARYARHNTLVVFAAARSEEQQRSALIDRMTALSRVTTFEAALAQAKREVELPGCSEHQLPWCVDIRICDAWNAMPSSELLDASPAGQWLLAHCAEYGWIRRYPEADASSHRGYHFRYVGKGHAAMMDALGLPLEDYLSLLRVYGVLTLMDDAGAPAVTVIACPVAQAGDTRMTLPLHGNVESVSGDNDGWALASCVYD